MASFIGTGTATDLGVNISDVATTIRNLSSSKEADLRTAFATAEQDGLDNSTAVLELQQKMNEWSFAVGLSSSMVKSMVDTFKQMVQKLP